MNDTDPTVTETDAPSSSKEVTANGRSALSPLTGAILLFVALGWLSLYILSLYHMLGAEVSSNDGAIVILALSLSGFFLGGTYAGAVMGMVWGEWSTHSRGPASYLSRAFMAPFGALLVAMAAGVVIFLLFLSAPSVAGLLSCSLALSIVVGGCLGIPRRANALAAGLIAFVPLLLLMVIRGYAMDPLFDLLESVGNMDRLTGYQFSQLPLNLLGGIACGLVAFGVLRLKKRGGTLWSYMIAGGIPGLIWLGAEIFNQVTSHILINFVQDLQILDIANRQMALDAQLNGSLTVLFAGATTAVLAFGLLLPKSSDEDEKADSESSESSDSAESESSGSTTPDSSDAIADEPTSDDSGLDSEAETKADAESSAEIEPNAESSEAADSDEESGPKNS